MSVLYDQCSDGPINSQEYKSFEIYAVTLKTSMTEYQQVLNKRSGSPFILIQQFMGDIVNPVISLFETLKVGTSDRVLSSIPPPPPCTGLWRCAPHTNGTRFCLPLSTAHIDMVCFRWGLAGVK